MSCNAWNHRDDCECEFRGGYKGTPGMAWNAIPHFTYSPWPVPRREPIRSGEYGFRQTACPRCGAAVYFIRPQNRGSVWLDEMGPPWPIHACFARRDPNKQPALRFARQLVKALDVPLPRAYLTGRTKAGDLKQGVDYSGSDWSGRGLRDSAFIGCNFTGADLSHADLSGSTFLRCLFIGANLTCAVLRRCDLRKSDLSLADLTHADLDGADIRDCIIDPESGGP